MGASEDNQPQRVKDADLARHWGCSAPYISKLKKPVAQGGKAMPDFADLGAADAWRAIHAPPRGRRYAGENRGENQPQPPPGSESTAESDGSGAATRLPPNNPPRGPTRSLPAKKIVDVRKFIKRTGDFEGLMLRQAESVPQIAYGLLELAAQGGDVVDLAAQLKNWAEAGKEAGRVRKAFLEAQEKSRALLPLDEVEDVVGTGLQEVRNAMLKHDERVATALVGKFSGEQLAIIRQAIAEDIDGIFRRLGALGERAKHELAS